VNGQDAKNSHGRTSALTFVTEKYGRVFRYIVVGAGTSLIYALLVIGLLKAHWIQDPVLASAVASLISQPVAFVVHERITYGDVPKAPGANIRFAVIALATFLVSTGLMKVTVMQHWPYWIAIVAGWFVVPAVNYVIGALWVFRARTLLSFGQKD